MLIKWRNGVVYAKRDQKHLSIAENTKYLRQLTVPSITSVTTSL